ncbi:MAG: archaeosortase/exosortase family protein [Candidatus Kapabacteria bacterium]|nr:archaeosortase/exosortase family protein [Ignavibacteriota bacterium]MCW5884693.1 archaeosortase/exosortase family protein [Candidatus Kapabacteria bacterium]
MKNKDKILRLVKFFGIYIGFIALYYVFISLDDNAAFKAYINFTSYISSLFIGIFDSSVKVSEQVIQGKSFNIILSFGCEGSEPMAVFTAGVLAYSASIKSKLSGLSIGLASLYFLNILRIALLYLIGNVLPSSFDLFHTTIFPIIFIIVALLFWILWIKKSADIKS